MELGSSTVLTTRLAAGPLRQHGGYQITDAHRHQVLCMRANGMSIDAIALVMDVSRRTIQKQFKHELVQGFEFVRGHMGAVLVQAGLSGNITAVKFWLSNRCAEWRRSRDELDADAPERDDEVVHFYLPPNGRDEPEDQEPPVIDGKAEVA
jgi:hypothetical protein